MTWNRDPKIPIPDCVKGRLYKIDSRNLSFGVYDGKEGFIGIRTKFGRRYLATEFHWDQGPPFGTVHSIEDTAVDVPEEIEVVEHGPEYEKNEPLFEWLEAREKELGDGEEELRDT